MLIHLGRQSSPLSRILRWGVLFVILAVVVGTGLYLLRRGSGKTDLFRAAMQALERGDRETAEQHFRTLLASGTQYRAVATQLMAILLEDERYDEGQALADEWRRHSHLAVVGWRAAIEIALRQLRLAEAETLAREQTELDAEFAQFTILRVRDLMGTFADRWAAQRAAVAMATLTASPEVRTRTFLFAAETLRDLLAQAEGPLKESIRSAYTRAVNGASTSLVRMAEVPAFVEAPAVKELRARIALQSTEPTERRSAEKTLKAMLAEPVPRHEVRASLAAYATSQAIWDDAVKYASKLAEGPPLLWIRAVQRLEARGRRGDVLKLLAGSPLKDDPLVALYEARVLLAGDDVDEADDADEAKGLDILGKLVARDGLHSSLALEAYRLLTAAGRAPQGIDTLVKVVRTSEDPLGQAALVEVLAAAGEQDKALALVRAMARNVDDYAEGVGVLSLLRRGDEALLREYLQAPIEMEGEAAGRRHFVRAAAAAAHALPEPGTPRAQVLRDAARADLEVLSTLDTAKADLAQAWQIALSLGEPVLVGRLAARAITVAGPPNDLAFSLIAWAAQTGDRDVRRQVADGLRAEAGSTPLAPFLETLAGVVLEHPDNAEEVRKAFAHLPTTGAIAVPALYLQAQVAWLAGDQEEGETVARRLHADAPDSLEARDLLGAFLLRRQAWDEVVTLHEGEEEHSLSGYRQIVVAFEMKAAEAGKLAETEKGEPAAVAAEEARTARSRSLSLARRAAREHPNSAAAQLLLAEVLWRHQERQKALGVLSVAPPTPQVNVLRAQILAEEGEAAVAEGLLRETIDAHPREVEPWRRLYLLLTESGARGRFIEAAKAALEGPHCAADEGLRAEIQLMRGMARLGRGEEDPALADFEAVIVLRPDDSVALNNAAWLLSEYHPERLEEAHDYAVRALAIDAGNEDIHDTAAVIYLLQADRIPDDMEVGARQSKREDLLRRAFEAAHRGIAIMEAEVSAAVKAAPSPRTAEEARQRTAKPGLRFNLALILDQQGRRGEAIRELERIVEEFPNRLEGIRAASTLRSWARE